MELLKEVFGGLSTAAAVEGLGLGFTDLGTRV